MAYHGPVICFLLSQPPREGTLARLDRKARSLLARVPLLSRFIPIRWAPARRAGYAAGLRACVQSLRRRHPDAPPIVLLRSGIGVTLADVDEIRPFDDSRYARMPSRSYYGAEIYHKLEIFNLRQFDRIVYLDCDTIVLDDISRLWDMNEFTDKGLYAVRETESMGVHEAVIGKFNTGVMVVNTRLLPEQTYSNLLQIAREAGSYDLGDQGVINRFLERIGQPGGELDPEYNVLVSTKTRGRWEEVALRPIRILHYVNFIKPWTPGHERDPFFDDEFLRLWDEAYDVRRPPLAQDADLSHGLE